MKSEVKLSVIVPIYNCEDYISRCLESLISQTLSEIEIIIIDDCSTDNSLKICKNYQKNDSRIKILEKEKNSGVSDSRNLGIKSSIGRYITFVDGDDFIDNNTYQECLNVIDLNNVDVLKFGYIKSYGKFNKVRKIQTETNVLINKEDFDKKIYDNIFSSEDYTAIWNTIVKRDLIVNTVFDKNLNFAEDFLFMMELIKKSKNIYFMNKNFYHYIVNSKSATQKIDTSKMLSRIDNIIISYSKALKIIPSTDDIYKQYSNKISNFINEKTGLVANYCGYKQYINLLNEIENLDSFKYFLKINNINYSLNKSIKMYCKLKIQIGLKELLKNVLGI